MALHALYEVVSCSISRCFCAEGSDLSAPGTPRGGRGKGDEPGRTSTAVSGDFGDNSSTPGGSSVGRRRRGDRRAVGLSLRDGEWDVLFEDDGGSSSHRRVSPGGKLVLPDRELEYADVAARARLAAEPSQHRTPTKGSMSEHMHQMQQQRLEAQRRQQEQRARSSQTAGGRSTSKSSSSSGGGSAEKEKRKRSRIVRSKSSIFRLNRGQVQPVKGDASSPPYSSAVAGGGKGGGNGNGRGGGGGASSFLDYWGAGIDRTLCFANPIRDDDADANDPNATVDDATDEEHTLNTCEDTTITSTLYFEAKLDEMAAGGDEGGGESSGKSHRPMPLFGQFRVHVDEDRNDEIRKIIEGETHRSHSRLGIILAYEEEQKKLRGKSHRQNDSGPAGSPEGRLSDSGGSSSGNKRQPNSPSSSSPRLAPRSPPHPNKTAASSSSPTKFIKKIPPPPQPQCSRRGNSPARLAPRPLNDDEVLQVIGADDRRTRWPPSSNNNNDNDASPPPMKLLTDSSQSTSNNSMPASGGSP